MAGPTGHGGNMRRHPIPGGQIPRPRQPTNQQHQSQPFVQQQKRY